LIERHFAGTRLNRPCFGQIALQHQMQGCCVWDVFQRGATPESIRSSYPLLTLEQVYGAITSYLAHQSEIDTYLQEEADKAEVERQAARAADPEFYGGFDEIRASRETTYQ